MRRRALITGITGQAGSYLAELLLEQDYDVVGIVRGTSTSNLESIEHIRDDVELVSGDLVNEESLLSAVEQAAPDEIYNLGAHSLTHSSWSHPTLTMDTTAVGVTRLLDAAHRIVPRARFFQAGSSECFGDPITIPQDESTPFRPRNPYGIAKAAAHWTVANYRERYSQFAVSGILYNLESPRRRIEFVTRRITDGVARIKLGLKGKLVLGDLDARRDWGYAPDYVRAMWLMLQVDEPSDFVIGTGTTHSVREFAELAFACADLDWREWVEVDPARVRPSEHRQLVADPSRACRILRWTPELPFEEIVRRMVAADLGRLSDNASRV